MDAADSEQDVLGAASGRDYSVEAWVRRFAWVWDAPAQRLDALLDLLSEDVVLRAPTRPPVSYGRAQARRAFKRAFSAMPDLRAEVRRWSATGEALFIELTFHVTAGGRVVSWDGVDRIILRDGRAVERVAYFDSQAIRRAFLQRGAQGLLQLARLRFGGAGK